jgi:hypothetical protein
VLSLAIVSLAVLQLLCLKRRILPEDLKSRGSTRFIVPVIGKEHFSATIETTFVYRGVSKIAFHRA